ncbi:hypothetical protein ACVRXA_08820 [Streptococcus pseudopneumoniae]|uniref:hypothetical protein n=1 Tax=Streptococcus pseudopneumoniae TaxID=257758 RepID=UPI00384ADF9D
MMSKHLLFYDIKIYLILYHAFFILSDDSLSGTLYPIYSRLKQDVNKSIRKVKLISRNILTSITYYSKVSAS